MIRMYDTNEDVLVVRKSDYQNNSIGDKYFLVPKDEWLMKDDARTASHHRPGAIPQDQGGQRQRHAPARP